MSPTINERELIRQAYRLEPLPASATRLARLVSSAEPDLDEILETISLDPMLTAQLLTYANSVAIGGRHPVDTVRMAVLRIGIGTALSLAVASCMQERLDQALPEYDLAQGELWKHSIVAALAAESVTSACRTTVSPASFTASLLHDIGKLVIARNLPKEAAARMRRIIEDGRSRLEAEVELCGLHHGALGGLIAEHWGLPEVIANGIAHHHNPPADTSKTADVVHVANAIAKGISPYSSSVALESEIADEDDDEDDLMDYIEPHLAPGTLSRLGFSGPVELLAVAEAASMRVADVLSHFD